MTWSSVNHVQFSLNDAMREETLLKVSRQKTHKHFNTYQNQHFFFLFFLALLASSWAFLLVASLLACWKVCIRFMNNEVCQGHWSLSNEPNVGQAPFKGLWITTTFIHLSINQSTHLQNPTKTHISLHIKQTNNN